MLASTSQPMASIHPLRQGVPGTQTVHEYPPLESKNWLIHQLYIQGSFAKCTDVIKNHLYANGTSVEYPIYCLGLISRQEGKAQESLEHFQLCSQLNPQCGLNWKQAARSLYLLGRHEAAVDAYTKALEKLEHDWEVLQNLGLCHLHMKNFTLAKKYLQESAKCKRSTAPLEHLARLHLMLGETEAAIVSLRKAVELSPENPDILSKLGIVYLKQGQQKLAFERLGTALSFQPNHVNAILAAGSIIQANGDYDVALTKYRVAAKIAPESAVLWNNIAMAFNGKGKPVAAISCLRRAHFLAPFEWRISANLGLMYIQTGQFASAFHHLSACIQLQARETRRRQRFALEHTGEATLSESTSENQLIQTDTTGTMYSLLALTLAGLQDYDNATRAHIEACSQDKVNPIIPLNYALFLTQLDEEEARKMLDESKKRLDRYTSIEHKYDTDEVATLFNFLDSMLRQSSEKPTI